MLFQAASDTNSDRHGVPNPIQETLQTFQDALLSGNHRRMSWFVFHKENTTTQQLGTDFRRKFNRICGTPKLPMLAVSGFPPILGWNVCDQIMDPIAGSVAVFLRWLACVCPHSLPVELRISLCEPGALPRWKKGPIKMQKKTINTGD